MKHELQKFFEQAVTHCLMQGKVSQTASSCAYRGPNGLKCAIGACITDEAYRPEHGWKNTAQPEVLEMLVASGWSSDMVYNNKVLLSAMQDIHDSGEPRKWREEFLRVGGKHSLDTKFMETLS